MPRKSRPVAFWILVVFIAVSYYDLTVRLGLQESTEQVGEFGAQVNRAFGAGDTIVYIPLLIASADKILLASRLNSNVRQDLIFKHN